MNVLCVRKLDLLLVFVFSLRFVDEINVNISDIKI